MTTEEQREYSRVYYQANKERINEKRKETSSPNLAYMRRYAREHEEKIKAQRKRKKQDYTKNYVENINIAIDLVRTIIKRNKI